MKNGTFKYPANRFGEHLPKRISALPDIRFYNGAVIHGFNDFMTYCRHSSIIRTTDSPLKRIRDEPVKRRYTEADTYITDSVSG